MNNFKIHKKLKLKFKIIHEIVIHLSSSSYFASINSIKEQWICQKFIHYKIIE
jgi:hypothetical protein